MGRCIHLQLFDRCLCLGDRRDGCVHEEFCGPENGQASAAFRIIVIISSTRLVGLQHQFLRLFDRQVLAFDDPLNTVFLVVMNKETQAVRIVTKDIVGTSSDNHTRTFFRQVTDRIALIQEQTVVRQKLAKELGIGYYDKELMALAAKESGLSEEFFEKADEKASSGLAFAFKF